MCRWWQEEKKEKKREENKKSEIFRFFFLSGASSSKSSVLAVAIEVVTKDHCFEFNTLQKTYRIMSYNGSSGSSSSMSFLLVVNRHRTS